MGDVIYCHQCAQDNPDQFKFCRYCGIPLYLQAKPDAETRTCSHCRLTNPSFAKFCMHCSQALVRTPSREPALGIPHVLTNRQKQGSAACPGCGGSAELISQFLNREAAKRTAFLGTAGPIVEKPSALEWTLREPTRIPSPRSGFINNTRCVLAASLAAPCLVIEVLRTTFPSFTQASPVVLVVAIAVAIGLVWTARGYLRKNSLVQAQFRWRQARGCSRCNAVFVTGEKTYASPINIDDILWNSPSPSA